MRLPIIARLRAGLVLCLTLVVCGVSFADEVHLTNGDRYSGKVVTLEKGTLKFDTGHGVVDVPWGDVTALAVTEPVLVTLKGQPERGVVLALVPDGGVTLRYVDRDADTPRPVTLAEIASLRRPAPPFSVVGGANAGFLTTAGNTDVNSLRLDGEVVVRARDNRYTASGALNHASDHSRETARNSTGTLRYDRFLNRRLYLNGSGLFTNDRFRDLDLRTALALGAGYQVADNTRAKLGIEGGYGYVNERFATQPDSSYHAARETVSLDVFVAGKRVVLFHRNDGFFGFTGTDNLFVQTRNGIRLGLVGGLVTTLQYDVDYDRSPAAGRKQTDTAVGLTFGYRF